MSKIMKKSWLPLFFTLIVFGTIAGGISMILSVEAQMSNKINKNTYRISINENEMETNFTNQDLLSWLNKQSANFTFYKNIPQEASRLSFSNENISIYNVDKGKAYINVWNQDDQVIKNGKKYFYFDGREYEVIGYIDNFTSVVANLISSLEATPKESIKGEYFLDAGENSELLIQDLLNTVQKTDNTIKFSYEKVKQTWINNLLNQKYALFIFLGTSVMLFVSGFTIVFSWVEKYKREMFVRRLSGAGETGLLLRVYSNMLVIRVIGILLGSSITFLITNILNLLPYNTTFRLESIVVGIILFFLMDIFYTLPMLFINQKKQLIKIMR
ncbi:TPA: ABC transporter permease [Bacillus cereus]|nr:ABC transporter permease [Bacillus cereus]